MILNFSKETYPEDCETEVSLDNDYLKIEPMDGDGPIFLNPEEAESLYEFLKNRYESKEPNDA